MFEELSDGIVISDTPLSIVIFSQPCIDIIVNYIQNTPKKNEAGGLLLGYRRGNHFEIVNITIPYKKDIRKKFYFERKDNKHITLFKKLQLASNNEISFLGEWHTHAEENPIPSQIDLSEWNKTKQKNSNRLIFFIFGTKKYTYYNEP